MIPELGSVEALIVEGERRAEIEWRLQNDPRDRFVDLPDSGSLIAVLLARGDLYREGSEAYTTWDHPRLLVRKDHYVFTTWQDL